MMRSKIAILLFVSATLLPAACIVMAAIRGGFWIWAALISMTFLVFAMDRSGMRIKAYSTLANWLPITIGFVHFAVLWTGLWAVGNGTYLDLEEKVLLVVTLGLFAGQVSNAAAHELIHRRDRFARNLGTAVFSSLLNGQHVSAHLLVHHVHAGTMKDPNSAPLGRGFYRFALTAAAHEFTQGWRTETQRLAGRPWHLHPYSKYLSGALLSLSVATTLGGVWGAVALSVISIHALLQLMLSDYVQHYGLRRRILPNGKPEPMGPRHSWNAPHPYSAALMMNAPKHSDHHMNPARDFSMLEYSDKTMPTLPYSLPVMGVIALVPFLWKLKMDPLVRQWSECSTPAENPASSTFTSPAPSE